jgi:hypothetical protein
MKAKLLSLLFLLPTFAFAAGEKEHSALEFPPSFDSYPQNVGGVLEVLQSRIALEPFNLVVSLLFLCAIIHALCANSILKISHKIAKKYKEKNGEKSVSVTSEVLHFFGEVEAVFGIWVVILGICFVFLKSWNSFVAYISQVNYTEPIFVVVIMAIAASKPIVNFAENNLRIFASFFGGTVAAYWFCILSIAPLLGSFITEPAAMTVSALLLGKQFYEKKPSKVFAYATIGLLFVNISIGGTLTHFAAPPVLIVASTWDWGILDMITNFGWKAVLAIFTSNIIYFAIFRKEFQKMPANKAVSVEARSPWIITTIHILFIVWTVFTAHYIPLFVGGFLFFLAFTIVTRDFQSNIQLKSPLLVGFFLAGLVIHGGLQGWWLEPILTKLNEKQLFFGSVVLTAFNDNAAITYLSSLVPNFSDSMKYAVVAGALTGGGLTVIANAPNPAGQSILSKYFKGGISPIYLALGALVPTAVASFYFLIFS